MRDIFKIRPWRLLLIKSQLKRSRHRFHKQNNYHEEKKERAEVIIKFRITYPDLLKAAFV